MMTPQLTEQYGQVERVSVARAIFSSRRCADAGLRTNPKIVAATPPRVATFSNSRRLVSMAGPSAAAIHNTRSCASNHELLSVAVRGATPCRAPPKLRCTKPEIGTTDFHGGCDSGKEKSCQKLRQRPRNQ